MERKFEYGDIQASILTRDKELNISIYRPPSYVIVYTSYKLLKMVQFWPTYRIANFARTGLGLEVFLHVDILLLVISNKSVSH